MKLKNFPSYERNLKIMEMLFKMYISQMHIKCNYRVLL